VRAHRRISAWRIKHELPHKKIKDSLDLITWGALYDSLSILVVKNSKLVRSGGVRRAESLRGEEHALCQLRIRIWREPSVGNI